MTECWLFSEIKNHICVYIYILSHECMSRIVSANNDQAQIKKTGKENKYRGQSAWTLKSRKIQVGTYVEKSSDAWCCEVRKCICPSTFFSGFNLEYDPIPRSEKKVVTDWTRQSTWQRFLPPRTKDETWNIRRLPVIERVDCPQVTGMTEWI